MGNSTNNEILNIDKEKLIDILTEDLPVLRAKIGLSQDELAELIGVSRQTYSAIETRKRRMTWNTFLSILLVFDNNEKTNEMLVGMGVFPKELRETLNIDNRKV
ncbi:helix-turn-helix transcriptional regulator [Luxibacter massiliensis]|uniref:helix-turn-helix transcriptional regulator n=1 Tax=Luxibacter massiliensis TaxID=2219695 RepID=UPI000F0593C4|nr:helix-turn-helix transcriptional regulator [Luxibacter massiliensis]